jgi:type II secretory pathway pseudopilin PulG
MNSKNKNESSNLILKLLVTIIIVATIAIILVPTLNGIRIEQEKRSADIKFNQVLDSALEYAVDKNISNSFTIEVLVLEGYVLNNPFNKSNVTFIYRSNGIIDIISPKGELEINGYTVYIVP